MPSVPVKIGASIQDGGSLHVRNPRSQSFSSFLSVLVRTGENDTKTLVWMKIFCFVFAVMKTDTFENALVWVGPNNLTEMQEKITNKEFTYLVQRLAH